MPSPQPPADSGSESPDDQTALEKALTALESIDLRRYRHLPLVRTAITRARFAIKDGLDQLRRSRSK